LVVLSACIISESPEAFSVFSMELPQAERIKVRVRVTKVKEYLLNLDLSIEIIV
jgi:hypothetical protein